MPGPIPYKPYEHPVIEPTTRRITRPWLLHFEQTDTILLAAGNVAGPTSVGATGNIAIFSNTTGKQLGDGGRTVTQVVNGATDDAMLMSLLLMGGG